MPPALIHPDVAPDLLRARDLLGDPAVAAAEMRLLLVRVQRGIELDIEAHPRIILRQHDSMAAQPLEHVNLQRPDAGQERVRTQPARHPDVVLHIVDSHAGKRVHHILVGVVAQADVEDDVAGGHGMSRVPHPLHPGRVAGADVIESGGKLMTDEIVLRCKHVLQPAPVP